VLDALALLSRLASQPVEEAFKQGRGRALDQFTRRGGEAGSIIRFAVEVFIPASSRTTDDEAPVLPNRYRYELTIERRSLPSGAERLAIRDESLRALDRGDREIFKQVAGDGGVRHVLLRSSGQEQECIGPLTHTVLASRKG